jgi:tetratricopeptide (TPR) repeat protein
MPLKTLSLGAAVIVLMTLLVYAPAMQAGFVWDDDTFLTENPLIKAPDGLYRFWLTTEAPDYFPLTSSSLWLEWRLWGRNATGYHVVNVALHAISAVLIWIVLRRLQILGAWLAGLVFAVHPVNVESVAWITERKNTLPMVFHVMTILLFLKFEGDGRRRWYFFSLGTFLMGLLSKTSVVMLPFVLLGCAWWQRGSVVRKDVVRSVPFFVLSGLLGLVTIWFQYNVAIGKEIVRPEGFFPRLAGAGWAVWFYLYKAIIPYNLSFVYPRWQIDASSVVSFVPAFILLACLMLFWWYRRDWGRVFLFAMGYYVVTLFPVLGFFDIYYMKYSLVADHWQYTSIIGIIAMVVGLGVWICHGWPKHGRQLATAAAVALVGLLSVLTWNQCHIYQDSETLWVETLKKNPASWIAHNNLGIILDKQGKIEEASAHYSEALRIKPDYAETHNNLGAALIRQGKIEQALGHYYKALQIKPDYAEAHNNLGAALIRQGKIKQALSHYYKALQIKPRSAKAHNNLAVLLAKAGRLDEAISHYLEALEIKPDFAEAHYNLGLAYSSKGQYDLAFKEMRIGNRLSSSQKRKKIIKGIKGEMPSISDHP